MVKRYQRDNQNPPIKEGQTKQWLKKQDKNTNNGRHNTTQTTQIEQHEPTKKREITHNEK